MFPDDNPRRHYYEVAHRALPAVLLRDIEPFRSAALAGHADGGLQKLWNTVAQRVGASGDESLLVRSTLHVCGGRTVILIAPPPPQHVTEAHLIAVVLDASDPYFIRYIVLEHSWDVTGASRTVLGEWTRTGNHINFGDGPEPTAEAFVAVVCEKFTGA